jgi:exodeoxyribonuclease VII large subunit
VEDQITQSIRKRLSGEESKLLHDEVRLKERIERLLAGKRQGLNQSLLALSRGAASRLAEARKDSDYWVLRMRQMGRLVEQRLATLDERERYLEAVRPERILGRGYSLTRDARGNIIRNASQVEPGEIKLNYPREPSPAR